MKKWVIPTAIVSAAAIVLACVWGGQAIAAKQADEHRTRVQQELQPTPTPHVDQDSIINALPSLLPDSTTSGDSGAPASSADPKGKAPGVTITTDENGNQVITPDWNAKSDAAIAAGVNDQPAGAPSANMGGAGGGAMDLDKDGTYHGDHPNETPVPDPVPSTPPASPTPAAPTPTPPSITPTPTPSTATTPKPETPGETPKVDPGSTPTNTEEPKETPVQTTPVPPPEDTGGSGSKPPDRDGAYNGEISADGKYGWFEGFGWVERGPGSTSTPSEGQYDHLSGNKVGIM